MLLETEIASLRSEPSAKPAQTERRVTGPAQSSSRMASIPRRSEPDSPSPAFAQQRLWFLDQLYPESPLYNFPLALRITGPLDREALKRAFTAIMARHEALRTHFVSVDGNPVQVIADPPAIELPEADLTRGPKAAREAEAERMLAAEARRPFNLAKDLMMRCLLLKLEPTEHILMVTMHHIATDAWSAGIFLSELAACYDAFSAGSAPVLPELPIQYADFAVWQRAWLTGEVLDKQLAYWKQQLAGAKEFLELPTDRPRPATRTPAAPG